jgi:trigger factor
LRRPVWTITDTAVEAELKDFLEGHGQIVPKLEGAAEPGDYVTADLTFHRPNGTILGETREQEIRLEPELRIQDGTIPNLAAALTGVKPGETRQLEARLGSSASDPSLRGATIPVQVRVHDLKQVRLPEIDDAFLGSTGFKSLDELRQGVREDLGRRLQAYQRQSLRRQILDELLRQAPFELPADLVSREEATTTARLVMELRQEGLSEREIRARSAEIRANAHESTLRSLKEFLLLAKIADVEKVSVEDEDVAQELQALAEREGESPRRVRARLEKEGTLNNLATQALERKVLDRILQSSSVGDEAVVLAEGEGRVETLDFSATAQAGQPAPTPGTTEGPGQPGQET